MAQATATVSTETGGTEMEQTLSLIGLTVNAIPLLLGDRFGGNA